MAPTKNLACPDGDSGALAMAQPDDFKLIEQIVAAGGHKHMTGELDRDKYQRLVELGWLKAFVASIGDASYQVTERGRAPSLSFFEAGNPSKRRRRAGAARMLKRGVRMRKIRSR
ncbi:hypothetical protein Q2941_46200 [Bradyrhizobium sp. UFLA05-153]